MKRIKLKRKRKIDKINPIIVVIILLILSIMIALIYINSKLSPLLLDYAELQTQRLASLVINKAVNKQIIDNVQIDKLFSTNQNKEGEIQTLDFNPTIVNSVLNATTNTVLLELKAIEQGSSDMIDVYEAIGANYNKGKLSRGIVFEIPLGAVTGNAFLSNLGPRIPVKLNLIGSVLSNLNTKISQYGINNALIEVSVKIDITEKVNLPLSSRNVTVTSNIPIAMKIIQGKIPAYYNASGINQNSPIFTLPIQ